MLDTSAAGSSAYPHPIPQYCNGTHGNTELPDDTDHGYARTQYGHDHSHDQWRQSGIGDWGRIRHRYGPQSTLDRCLYRLVYGDACHPIDQRCASKQHQLPWRADCAQPDPGAVAGAVKISVSNPIRVSQRSILLKFPTQSCRAISIDRCDAASQREKPPKQADQFLLWQSIPVIFAHAHRSGLASPVRP